jgi:ATP-dependent RNA helicase DOB1
MWLDASSAVFKNGPRIKHGDFAALAPGPAGINAKEGRMEVVPVTMATIDALSQLRVGLPKEIKSIDQRLDLRKAVQEVKRRFPDGLPLLDPIKNMHIKDDSFRNLVKVRSRELKLLTIENRGNGVSINEQCAL